MSPLLHRLSLLPALAGVVAHAAPAAAAEPPLFTEEAAAAGLDFVHFNGASGKLYFPEIMGSGGALLDYDGDGDLDVFLVQGAMLPPGTDPAGTDPPARGALGNRLYRNDVEVAADGARRLRFTDVSRRAGIAVAGDYGMGAAVGDYDGDGRPDLYVTNFGSNRLWRNRGDGTFEDVTAEARADDPRWSIAAAFFDYDGDGDLDLYVGNYVDFGVDRQVPCFGASGLRDYCGPDSYPPTPDRLLRNRGDGTFEDVTAKAGLSAAGAGLGMSILDADGDGDLDLYVANDGDPNFLWINRGDGTFEDEALLRGCAVNADGKSEASMGVAIDDFDGDGDEDVFLSHLDGETNTLYVNDGKGFFLDRTAGSGLDRASWSMTGFGTGWIDYDNDGKLGLLVVNGAVKAIERLRQARDPWPFHQPNQLFRNAGGGRFVEVPAEREGPAFELSEVSRGALFGDLDNDGDVDVVVTQDGGPVRLLVNRSGDGGRWVGLALTTGEPARDEPGARAEVTAAGGRTFHRRVRPAAGYASSNDPRILIGLGAEDGPVAVIVRWPDGGVERWSGLAPGRYHQLHRGTGAAAPAPGRR
jgi:hypothetical protein